MALHPRVVGGVVARLLVGVPVSVLSACSLFTDFSELSDPPLIGTPETSTIDSPMNGDAAAVDGGANPDADGATSFVCVTDDHTLCESFDLGTKPSSLWEVATELGQVQIQENAGAPSAPNVLRVSTSATPEAHAWAVLRHNFSGVVPEEVTFEQDLFVEANSTQYQNLSMIELLGPANTAYAFQLARVNGETLIEELVKNPDGGQTTTLSSRTTALGVGKWYRLKLHFKKGIPGSFDVAVDGTTVITGAMRTDPVALSNGATLSVAVGISYVARAPSLTLGIDNVKVTWK